MITSSKVAVLGLFLLASSIQTTQCFTPLWHFSICFGETPTKKLIQQHLDELEHDLIGHPDERVMLVIPERDIKNIKKMGKNELQHLTYRELQNKDHVHLVLGSVMKEYVTNEARSIARTAIDDKDKVNTIAASIGNSFGTRLEHTPARNGQALREFFGPSLQQKVRESIFNSTYAAYYNPHD